MEHGPVGIQWQGGCHSQYKGRGRDRKVRVIAHGRGNGIMLVVMGVIMGTDGEP